MSAERRHAARREVNVMMNMFDRGVPTLCVAEDVSLSGMRLRKMSRATRGLSERVLVEFKLPGHEAIITARARCVHDVDPQRFGLEFIGLSAREVELLHSFTELA